MKKSVLILMGFLASSITHNSQSVDRTDLALSAIAVAAPFYYYMFTKNPVVNPPKDYTLSCNNEKFWSLKNAWYVFDQLLIGQRYKTESLPIDNSLPKSKECFPSGFVGNFHEHVINIGGSAARSLFIIYGLLNAKGILKGLKAFN